MRLQSIISRIQTFFNYLFESLTMRTKPKYMPVYEEDEILYLNESMSIER
jgi:division protein CdvB (Snf7/Vps24/ESCRT-III family)